MKQQTSPSKSISIFGLGYVGTVTAACLTEAGHHVTGVDVQPAKVNALVSGNSPIVEPEVDALLKAAHKANLIAAHDDTNQAVSDTEISIVCVGTPSTAGGMLDLRYVEAVTAQIADALTHKTTSHLLIFRSTMLPGSTRNLVKESLQEFIDEGRLEVLFVPEFLREGTAVADFRDPSLSVVGTIDGAPVQTSGAESLLGRAKSDAGNGFQQSIVCWEEAETIKYACNAFHALKVGFANEIGRLAKAIDIDGRKIMDIVCDDTKLNISRYYMRPGNPYGGSCLPKDVAALNSLASMHGVVMPLVQCVEDSNRRHQDLLVQRATAGAHRKVCILGLSFKSATDDLRNSPMVFLAETLLGKGYDLTIFDPQLQVDRLVGSNESMTAKSLPHLHQLMNNDPGESIAQAELLIVFQKCVSMEVLAENVREDQHIIDVNSWKELEALPATYEGLCWEAEKRFAPEYQTT